MEGEGGIFTSQPGAAHTHIHVRSRGREETGVGEVTEVIARCGTSVAPERCSLGVCRVRKLFSAVCAFLSLPVYLLRRPTYGMTLLSSLSRLLPSSLSLLRGLALTRTPSARQKVPPTPFAGRVTGSLDHASCTARTNGVSQPRYHHTSSTTESPSKRQPSETRVPRLLSEGDSGDSDHGGEAEDSDNDRRREHRKNQHDKKNTTATATT